MDAPPVIMLADRSPDADEEDKFRWAEEMSGRGITTIICRPSRTRGRTLERVIKKVVAGKADIVRMKREPAAEPVAVQDAGRSTPAPITAVSATAQSQPVESPVDARGVMAERWLSIPNEPISLEDFTAKFCEPRSKENRQARKRALLAAARHKTVMLPPLAGNRKHGQSNKYFVHDLLAAWHGYLDEGVELPPLLQT